MMKNYYVKQDLYGPKAGEVHRFADHKAAPLVLSGAIEAYDKTNKRHREATGSPESDARNAAERDRKAAELREAAKVK